MARFTIHADRGFKAGMDAIALHTGKSIASLIRRACAEHPEFGPILSNFMSMNLPDVIGDRERKRAVSVVQVIAVDRPARRAPAPRPPRLAIDVLRDRISMLIPHDTPPFERHLVAQKLISAALLRKGNSVETMRMLTQLLEEVRE